MLTRHRMKNSREAVMVMCGDTEPYCVITQDLPTEFTVKCVRCGAEINLVARFQEDLVEAARSALVIAELVFHHYQGPIPYFRALLDSNRK